MCPDGVQPVLASKSIIGIQSFQQVEPSARTLHHRDGYGAIERNCRAGCDLLDQFVQREYLRPVGVLSLCRLVVESRDGAADMALPGLAASLGNEFDAFGDGLLIPLRAVLLGQRHKAPVRPGTRRTPRIGKQHEGKQTRNFRILRHQVLELAS
jgi:hypothetical protein